MKSTSIPASSPDAEDDEEVVISSVDERPRPALFSLCWYLLRLMGFLLTYPDG